MTVATCRTQSPALDRRWPRLSLSRPACPHATLACKECGHWREARSDGQEGIPAPAGKRRESRARRSARGGTAGGDVRGGRAVRRRAEPDGGRWRAQAVGVSRRVQRGATAARRRADQLRAVAQPRRALRRHPASYTCATESYHRRWSQPPSSSCHWWASITRNVGRNAARGLMRVSVCRSKSTTRPKGSTIRRRASARCSAVA